MSGHQISRVKWVLPLFMVMAIFFTAPAVAAEPEFEFIYQKVTAIEFKEEAKKDKKWWEKVIDFGKDVIDKGKMVVDQAKMRFFPGDYTGTVRSVQNSNVSYKVERITVRDEAHLLELMGVKNGDLSTLTNGQRGLLESYRFSKSEAVKERAPYGYRKKSKVLLTDLTLGEKLIAAMDNDKKDKAAAAMKKDFWPMSVGSIQLNSKSYSGNDWQKEAQGMFMHEYSHTLDRAIPAGLLDEGVKTFVRQGGFLYGSDGNHFTNERTSARVAFMEGWAEFNELSITGEAERYRQAVTTVTIENRNGKYTDYPATSLTGKDLLAVEGINALILWDIAATVPGGKEKVFAAFAKSNNPFHSLKNLTQEFVRQNPDQTAVVAAIIDKNTFGKLTDAELKNLLGLGKAVDAYLASRGASEATIGSETTGSTTADQGVNVRNSGGSPFGTRE